MVPRIGEKKTYTVYEVMKILGIGRNAAYKLVNLESLKLLELGKQLGYQKNPSMNG